MNTLVMPMLAVSAEPFDSPEYLFEVKWDGVRALAFADAGGWRMWGREGADYTGRYPELEVLGRLPCGTILDGEVIVLAGGRPDLETLLARHQLLRPDKIRALSQVRPVTYVVFDVLSVQGQSLLSQPLWARRQVLCDTMEQLEDPRLVFSEGLVGTGCIFFDQAVQQGHEGMMAKHLASPYRPGRRSAAWKKIKPKRRLPCVIVGYVPGRHEFRGLLVAAPHEGKLQYVADLRVGFTEAARTEVQALLAGRERSRPVIPCPEKAVWVEPELYCQVRFLDWTSHGRLRGASFAGLLRPCNGTTDLPPD
jgi:DNA ligase D-like protein (predicted ligase)